MKTVEAIFPSAGADVRAISVLVTAFAADPAVRWMYPDPQQYRTHFPDFVRAFGGKAFETGTAEWRETSAVALWLAPGFQTDEAAVIEVLERSVAPAKLPQLFAIFEQMGKFHPETPHWYLPLIGVEPNQQGQGHGSALLQQALTRCDREGHVAYLENTNPRNVSLYERHGFKVLGRIQVADSPEIIPMLRSPQNGRPGTISLTARRFDWEKF